MPETTARRILVADDSRVHQLLLRRILQQAGHTVEIVENGAEAVAAFKQHSYDLVFLDFNMPVMGGLEAAMAIRQFEQQQPSRPATPIIALTADDEAEGRHGSEAAGMTDFLAKPAKPADLIGAVQRHTGSADS